MLTKCNVETYALLLGIHSTLFRLKLESFQFSEMRKFNENYIFVALSLKRSARATSPARSTILFFIAFIDVAARLFLRVSLIA